MSVKAREVTFFELDVYQSKALRDAINKTEMPPVSSSSHEDYARRVVWEALRSLGWSPMEAERAAECHRGASPRKKLSIILKTHNP